ncbi:unnamed protein product, partial [Closterium sp. NIES-65]
MLLGFLLVLALTCGPRYSEGARGRLLSSNENDRRGLSVQASVGPSVAGNVDSGDSWAHLRVRDGAPVQRQLQQQEQRDEKLINDEQLQAAEQVRVEVEKQRMLAAIGEWKPQENVGKQWRRNLHKRSWRKKSKKQQQLAK